MLERKRNKVFKNLKHNVIKMFRELLVYHHSSLEYRAKILTLMVSANGGMCECEEQVLKEIAHTIYSDDEERAEFLIEAVHEYHDKIITNNGLDFEHLIQLVIKETKSVKRFAKKIDMESLMKLYECTDKWMEEDVVFQKRILAFLKELKDEYVTSV